MISSYRQLLVHVDDTDLTAKRLSLARSLAAEQSAAAAALYAARSSYEMAWIGAEMPATVLEEFVRLDEERMLSAKRRFDAVLQQPGPPVSWGAVRDIDVIGTLVRQALCADLLILGQRDADEAQAVPQDLVPTVIIESGKPSLVVPYAGDVNRFATVVIAWKPTRETARAVFGAMPLLQRAERVVVVTWGETEEAVNGSGLDLLGYLRVHGVAAHVEHEGVEETPRLGEYLLSRAFDLSADLLVMGCYGHSRAREWVLGGVTRTVLESMTVPVLMAH